MFSIQGIPLSRGLIYLAAAVLPAIAMMIYIYNHDKREKEPRKLLLRCVIGGFASALAAIALETGGTWLLEWYYSGHPVTEAGYAAATAVMVALSEEGTKFFFLKRSTWRSPEFNYRFDGIVYAVFVSLGFAALENVMYVFSYGDMGVAFQRAVLTIPAHMSFAVYMGIYYAQAKNAEVSGNAYGAVVNQWMAYLAAAFLHAVYDGSLMIGSDASIIFFYVFVILLDIAVIRTIRSAARRDKPIY